MEITIDYKVVKFRVDAETFKLGKLLYADKDDELMSEAQSGGEPMDDNIVRDYLQISLSKLKDILHRFITFSTTDDSNAIDSTSTEWSFTLDFKDPRRKIDSKSLAELCHSYLVNSILQNWCKMAMPNYVSGYVERMKDDERDIKRMVFRKQNPTI